MQPAGPYRLAGYSFGACIVFEMALQLERAGQHMESLVLLDGSHSYVAAHTQLYKERLTPGDETQAECEALCAFMVQFMTIDYKKVCIFPKLRLLSIQIVASISHVANCSVLETTWSATFRVHVLTNCLTGF